MLTGCREFMRAAFPCQSFTDSLEKKLDPGTEKHCFIKSLMAYTQSQAVISSQPSLAKESGKQSSSLTQYNRYVWAMASIGEEWAVSEETFKDT